MLKNYIIFIFLLMFSSSLFSQGTFLTLEGTVKDNQGEPLIGASVSLTDVSVSSIVRGSVTDQNGRYLILAISPGTYNIKVSMIGYKTYESKNVRFIVGQKPTLNIVLIPEAVQLTGVTVVGARTSNFELKRQDVSTAVVAEQIENLPLNSRNIMNLAAVVPGVRTFTEIGGRGMPSAGSLPDLRFVNFYVDGAEWKNLFNGNIAGLGQTGSVLPQDGVQEFRFILSPFDAEFTRGGAYIINTITKKGSNLFKANAFMLYRDKDLNTRMPNEKIKSPYKRQQWGFNVSGPIMQDKLFFNASFESHNTKTIYTVSPGRPAYNPGIWDKYAKTYTAPTDNMIGTLRLTYVLNENQNLDYIWSTRTYDAIGFFGGINDISNAIHSVYHINSHMLKHTYILSPTTFNEVSLHYLRWIHDEPAYEDRPMYAYPSLLLGNSGFPIAIYENHYRLIEKFTTKISDFHTLKTGFEATYVTFEPWFPAGLNPRFNFLTDSSKVPYSATIGVGVYNPTNPNGIDARTNDKGYLLGFYVQDQWNVNERLTVNLGLRWDAEINTLNNTFKVAWADSADLRALLDPKFLNTGNRKNDWDNFAPRFSFTYDLNGDGQTIVRGGAGRSFDRIASYIGYFERRDASWRQYQFTFNNTNNLPTLDPDELRRRIASKTGGSAGAPSMNLLPDKLENPVIDQVSLGIANQFNDELGASVDFLYQNMDKIYVSRNANYLDKTINKRRLTSKYGDIQLWYDDAKAENMLIMTSVNYKTSSFNITGSYTFNAAKSTYDGSPSQNRPITSDFLYFRSNGEEKHRFVLSGYSKLPYGFKLSGIFTLASPRPFDVVDGRDLNKNNTTGDDYINGERNMLPDLNKIRNWYKMFDLRLSYLLDLKEYEKNIPQVEFMLDIFNVGNWVNISGYRGTKYDQAGNALTTFGLPTGYFLGRQVQLGIKVSY
ncbi:TonB-dependent receptor [Stygiobacter electus]|uniref:TonB-dependent receptor n=1 Tax=Stygiobacter electus TaxID=3032292 RepID=A0AAE3TDY7_9BACT|nr:TonB-dependent receptor [Stygiobacter electus]MDF1611703.1 TonB-dependent receptor [Stygiobacter electus]